VPDSIESEKLRTAPVSLMRTPAKLILLFTVKASSLFVGSFELVYCPVEELASKCAEAVMPPPTGTG
jgi:hypothetical protein